MVRVAIDREGGDGAPAGKELGGARGRQEIPANSFEKPPVPDRRAAHTLGQLPDRALKIGATLAGVADPHRR